MTPSQAQAWFALELGPVWLERSRSPLPSGDAGGSAASVQAGSENRSAASAEAGSDDRSAALDSLVPVAHDEWRQLRAEIEACRACSLGGSRRRAVMGEGPSDAGCLVIGEAPGAEEDRQGLPFVGRAGVLLDQMLAAVGLDRQRDVYITNTLKCRPPDNRNPEPVELARCRPFLERQIVPLQPRVVVLLGRFAAQSILQTDASIASLRGRVHQAAIGQRSLECIVTYHPAYLLRNPLDKAKAWRDWVSIRAALGSSS